MSHDQEQLLLGTNIPVEVIDELLTADLDIFFGPGNFKTRHRRTLKKGVMT